MSDVPAIAAAVTAAVSAVVGAFTGARYTLARAQKLRAEADSIMAATAGSLLDQMRTDMTALRNRVITLEAAVAERTRSYDELNGQYANALHRIAELEDEVRELRTKLEVYESGRRQRERADDERGGVIPGAGV